MSHYQVRPVHGPLSAVVDLPGSKSIANRALVCASLAEGTSELIGLPDGDDTAAMAAALDQLGVAVVFTDTGATVHGRGVQLSPGPSRLDARLAGTTSRFLTALAALGPGPYVIDGGEPLRGRPMAALHTALTDLGFPVTPQGAFGHLPVQVGGPRRGSVSDVTVAGDISSQYISALMMIGPYLDRGLHITLSTPLVSRPYVDMTAAVMASFGVAGVVIRRHEDHEVIDVPPGRYAPQRYVIEPDASSASYPLAAAAMVGGTVLVRGLHPGSLQGDTRFSEVLAAMGARVSHQPEGLALSSDGALRGVDVDLRDISDCAPTLAVVAAVADSPTQLRGIGFIRGKESDRIGDVVGELRRCGVDAQALADGLVVRPGTLHGATVQTHHDHRVAMAFALLGLVTPGIVIADAEVVAKSFPGYWQMLESLSH
jgi:3-phosphoshikimate 1-carboxyvinyltransferase